MEAHKFIGATSELSPTNLWRQNLGIDSTKPHTNNGNADYKMEYLLFFKTVKIG
ncbi:hypothetical protein [Moorena sp. SIO3A2]|uniref:hypothetical protein n=1 Tax=Moorena sp. SIO3A2 TaxID=2607841 RepID=UPI0013B6E48B|nr:hypothetical protein [Moorena sp. SIO3A2]NER89932.1 hypothetical protein [Moorena sp. SIO3A2]